MGLTYEQSGVDYAALDRAKRAAQQAAASTGAYIRAKNRQEVSGSRGESAYVWKQGSVYMASVVEGLGTKNLVADAMRRVTGKTYYDIVAHDTVASIVNDLVTVGAKPLVIHAYWCVGDSAWLEDTKRMRDLIRGWKSACAAAGASWGGGETPTYRGIVHPETIDLAGAAVGIIEKKSYLVEESGLRDGDAIIFLKSNGVNANGLSLARRVAERLKDGYATPLTNGVRFGDALLRKSNIYARLIERLLRADIPIHYIANITGHGLRKIMRARRPFSYVIERLFPISPLFRFIQEHADMSDKEMYQTFNMGQDYALFVSPKDAAKTLRHIHACGWIGMHAGHVEKGNKQVILRPKNIVYDEETLSVR